MSTSVEWATAEYVTQQSEVVTREALAADEWTDAYGSTVTEPMALFMDNGSGLIVIEGSADELRAFAARVTEMVNTAGGE